MRSRLIMRPSPGTFVWLVTAIAFSAYAGIYVDGLKDYWAPLWAVPAATVTSLAVYWPHRAVPRDRRFLSLVAAALVAFVVGAMVAGSPPVTAVWMSVVNIVVSFGLAWAYRARNSIDDWAPGNAADAAWLCVLGTAASIVAVLLRGVPIDPALPFLDPAAREWISRVAGGTLTVLPPLLLFHITERPTVTRTDWRLRNVPLAALSILCLVLPTLVPEYPLSWLPFVPALWMGLTFPPRVVALLAIIGPIVTMGGTTGPYWETQQNYGMRPYVIMLVVSLIASTSAFVIAQQREDTARLTEELATRRIRTAADNAILDGVFGAMNDGVLVTDPDGRVVLTNRAAQHLLGTKVSPGERESTLLAGLLRPDGSGPLTREHVRGFLAETDGGVLNVAVPADSSSGLRSLGLTSRPLLQSNRAHRLIMFRDTTAQQERQHQLKVFARSVARDLNKPLESLGNAIGTTQDLLWNEESHAAGVALERTVQSAMRIRSLIDDHIAATLAREGVIRPTEIELSALLKGTVWSSGLEDFLLEIQTPHAVFADESLVRQLVMNLIQGAVERAEEGQLASVRVISAPADGQGWVSVSFADRGAPLTSGPQTAPGAQADPAGRFADSPRLALCHTIVSRHGGQLSVESTDSGASTITFTLPAA